MKTNDLIRKNYNSLDVAKFLCALSIISAHFASEWGHFPILIDYAFSIYIIAVPFFFVCSGFLFSEKFFKLKNDKEKKMYFIKYERKIITIYLWWSLIYFLFVVVEWISNGTTLNEVLDYVHIALVFTTYPTIWYLPALGVGIALLYVLQKKLSVIKIFLLGLALYVIGALGFSYSFVQDKVHFLSNVYHIYNMVFETSRNGLFNGLPFVAMGALISIYKQKFKFTSFSLGLISFFSLIAIVCEAFILKTFFNNVGADTVFFLLPFEYFFMLFLITIKLPSSRVYLWLRELSTMVFTSQRLFLTAIPGVIPGMVINSLYENSYIGLLLVIGITLLFSFLVIVGSKKYSFLKVLF
ncbi:acyltransferase family protein [Neobacillus sp. SAB-20_R2A]|uniref:acyltransferase family protein n=1 Tax=Neobacillus sp. SAB-20_R2A TaxID=3120519 RepID=UPI003C6DE08E